MRDTPLRRSLRVRPGALCWLSLTLGGLAWGLIGWGVVLTRPVPVLPIPVWGIWITFVAVGLALPAWMWNRTVEVEVDGGVLNITTPLGRRRQLAVDELWRVAHVRDELEWVTGDGRAWQFCGAAAAEVAAALEAARRPADR